MKKVIVITGASDGIGKGVAETLSKDNDVIILSRDEEKTKSVANEIGCDYKKCDVTKNEEVISAIEYIIEKYNHIDVLINNAGIWVTDNLEDTSYEDIDRCIDINTKGTIYTTKAVLDYMYKAGKGFIINIVSQLGMDTEKATSIYAASKWALRGFTLSMQKDACKRGVKVTGIYPGFINTKIFEKNGNDYDTTDALEVNQVVGTIKFLVDMEHEITIPEIGIKSIKNYY